MPFGLCVGAHFARPPAAPGAETLWGHPAAGMGEEDPSSVTACAVTPSPGGEGFWGAALEAAPTGCLRSLRRGALCACQPPAGRNLWGPSCGWDGGRKTLIRHGMRRDTPVGEGFGAALEAAPMGCLCGLCVALCAAGGTLGPSRLGWGRPSSVTGPSCGGEGGRKTHPSRHAPGHLPPGGKALGHPAAGMGEGRPLIRPMRRPGYLRSLRPCGTSRSGMAGRARLLCKGRNQNSGEDLCLPRPGQRLISRFSVRPRR